MAEGHMTVIMTTWWIFILYRTVVPHYGPATHHSALFECLSKTHLLQIISSLGKISKCSGSEHPYALLTPKGRAIEVGTLERAGEFRDIIKPFGMPLAKRAMKDYVICLLSSPGILYVTNKYTFYNEDFKICFMCVCVCVCVRSLSAIKVVISSLNPAGHNYPTHLLLNICLTYETYLNLILIVCNI